MGNDPFDRKINKNTEKHEAYWNPHTHCYCLFCGRRFDKGEELAEHRLFDHPIGIQKRKRRASEIQESYDGILSFINGHVNSTRNHNIEAEFEVKVQ